MMLAAARALGTQVTDSEQEQGAVLPDIARLRCDPHLSLQQPLYAKCATCAQPAFLPCREVSLTVAAAVASTANVAKVASAPSSSRLGCLPVSSFAPEHDRQSSKAEACIAQLQYDPFQT